MEGDAFLRGLRDARFHDGVRCPRCGGDRVHRWGSFGGRQRYRCLRCRRTFSDLTATPAAYLKKAELLREYAERMAQGLSLRKSARQLGIHPSTAFRWRHRLCGHLATKPEALDGRVETVSVRLPRSLKGQRHIPRSPRRRRSSLASVYRDQICVVFATDRIGGVASGAVDRPHARPDDLERVLGASLSEGVPLISAEGPIGAVGRFARARGGQLIDARRARPRGLEHVRIARAYASRFLRWSARFRGVSTRYLEHYLAWHRHLDYGHRHHLRERVLRWPLEDLQALHSSREQNRGSPLFGPTPSEERAGRHLPLHQAPILSRLPHEGPGEIES